MNVDILPEAKKLVSGVKKKTSKIRKTEVVFCPPFVYLQGIAGMMGRGSTAKWKLGVQNVSTEDVGSYTGEVSARQLKQFNTAYAIIGHSERRKMGETDEQINKKVLATLRAKISPILCVGEQVHDEDGAYLEVVKGQLTKALKGVAKNDILDCVVAYEPVWAIGATVAMNSHDIHEMTLYIKKCLRDIFGSFAGSVAVLYGGAVNPTNIEDIVRDGCVDGVLVGRDSLDVVNFSEIVRIVEEIK